MKKNRKLKIGIITIPQIKYLYWGWAIILLLVCSSLFILYNFPLFFVNFDSSLILGLYLFLTIGLLLFAKSYIYNELVEYLKNNYDEEWIKIKSNPLISNNGYNTFGFIHVITKKSLENDKNIVACKKYFLSLLKLAIYIFISYIVIAYIFVKISPD
jgi:hypothetical protein